MSKKVMIFIVVALWFSLSLSLVNADKPGTCINPNGGNYCGQKSQVSDCYCDNVCKNYGDCCSDYKEVCLQSGTKPLQSKPIDENTTPKITDIQGYDPDTQQYTQDVYAGKYMILYGSYGSFAEKENVVVVGVYKHDPTYESTNQINVLLRPEIYANALWSVYVQNSAGISNIKQIYVKEYNNPNCKNYCDPIYNTTRCVNSYQYNCIKNSQSCYDWDWYNSTDCPNGCDEFGKKCKASQIPQPPFNLQVFNLQVPTADVVGGKLIAALEWKSVGGIAFYIYKNKNDGAFIKIGKSEGKSFKDLLGLSKDVKYGYYVTAVNDFGESGPSNIVYVFPYSGDVVEELYKCVFKNSTSLQECYSEKANCKGIETCGGTIKGTKGENVNWKSSCGGYVTTVIDGTSKYVEFACIKENQKNNAAIDKSYVVNKPFTLTATAESPFSQIVSAKWDMNPTCKPTNGNYFSKINAKDKYYTEINVVCSNAEPVKFTVNFEDGKELTLYDTIYVYVNKENLAGGGITQKVELEKQESIAANSCKDSCGGKSKNGNCYCDLLSVTKYGDFCKDTSTYCPEIWNIPENKYKNTVATGSVVKKIITNKKYWKD